MATLSGTHDFVRYNAVARLFHAVIAALVLFNILTGIFGEAIEDIWQPFPAHKATGILILFLSLARLAWRFTWTMPAWPATMGKLQQSVARLTHGALYVLMIVVPFTGWIFPRPANIPFRSTACLTGRSFRSPRVLPSPKPRMKGTKFSAS